MGGFTHRRLRVPAHALERGSAHAEVSAAWWDGPNGSDDPVVVCVHGLGGSHLNWTLLAPFLAARYGTVWAPDLAGFGHTRPGTRSARLEDNLDLLRGFVRTVSADRPVVLVGNSLGGLLSVSLGGRHPELAAALVLVGPAVPPIGGRPDRAVAARFAITMTPGLGEAWLRRRERWLTPAEQVRESLRVNARDPDGIDVELVQAQVRLVAQRRAMPHARQAQLAATRTMLGRLGPTRRQLWEDMAAVTAPTLVLHGGRDRLVDEQSVRSFVTRRPDWEYRVYPDLGHLVMIEDAPQVAADMISWLPEPLSGPPAGVAGRTSPA